MVITWLKSLAFYGSLLILSGCATTPQPTPFLDNAQAAIERAEQTGAVEHAPLELRYAREKLASASVAVEQRKYQVAMWLAEQSVINSQLALAKTAAARARDAARRQREANAELRADLDSGNAPVPAGEG